LFTKNIWSEGNVLRKSRQNYGFSGKYLCLSDCKIGNSLENFGYPPMEKGKTIPTKAVCLWNHPQDAIIVNNVSEKTTIPHRGNLLQFSKKYPDLPVLSGRRSARSSRSTDGLPGTATVCRIESIFLASRQFAPSTGATVILAGVIGINAFPGQKTKAKKQEEFFRLSFCLSCL